MQFRVGQFEVVLAELHLVLVVYLAVCQSRRPNEIENAIALLDEHGDPFEPVRQLQADRVQFQPPHLLKVRILGDLHAVEPHLPPEPGRPEGGRFPVVLDETHVVLDQIDPNELEAVEVDILRVVGRRLDEHLVLVVVLQAVGVVAVPPVGRSSRRLDVRGLPRLGAETAQRGGRIERARAGLDIVRLHHGAAVVGPVARQRQDDILKGEWFAHAFGSSLRAHSAARPRATSTP